MNQILMVKIGDEQIKKEKKKTSSKSWFRFQLSFSLLILFLAILFFGYHLYSLWQKEKVSSHLIHQYNITKLYTKQEENSEAKKNQELFGIIEIPKINLYYPIFSQLTEEKLKIAPCKFYGETPDKNSNLCIAGHNYDNSLFFSKISLLQMQDEIYIFDETGKKYMYEVVKNYEVNESDLSPIFNYSRNQKEITLITCNNLNKNRIIIKAKQKSF